MNFMLKNLLTILLICVSPSVLAGPFDPVPTDESITLLGYIFGSNVGDIFLGGTAFPTLYGMISYFNSACISVGLVILGYVAIVSTINTAQEGEVLGKSWSSIWIPIRTIIGLSSLIPSSTTGYCLVQVTVMYIVLQGAGAADYIWTTALEGLRQNQSPATGIQSDPTIDSVGINLTKKVLPAAICIETYKLLATQPDHAGQSNDWLNQKANQLRFFTRDDTDQIISTSQGFRTVTVTGSAYFGVNDGNPTDMGACGKLKISATASLADYPNKTTTDLEPTNQELLADALTLYTAKVTALEDMYAILQPLAKEYVEGAAGKGTDFVIPDPNGTPKPLPSGYVATANDIYGTLLSNVLVPADTQTGGTDPAMTQAINIGEQAGWSSAGSYYFILNKALISKTFADAKNPPAVAQDETFVIHQCDDVCIANLYSTNPKPSALLNNQAGMVNGASSYGVTSDNDLLLFTKALAYGAVYVKYDNNNTLGFSTNISGSGGAADIANFFRNVFVNPIIQGFAGLMSEGNGQDPMLQHVIFGRNLMITAEFVWIGLVGGAILTTIFAYLPLGFGTGPAAVSFMIITLLFGIFLPIIGMIWGIGASLAIYAPLIPYMMFTLGVVGWLMLVVEGMVAAPLVALSLVIPSGDDMGKLEVALNLLANIFLRPTLMIFGFILAGRVYSAIVGLISYGMLDVFNTINVATIFSFVVIIFVYASFILAVTNGAFSLIYILPDKIMRWIGGSPMEHTDVSAMEQVKAASQQASGEIGKGMQESGKKAFAKSARNLAETMERVDAASKGAGKGGLGKFSKAVKGLTEFSERSASGLSDKEFDENVLDPSKKRVAGRIAADAAKGAPPDAPDAPESSTPSAPLAPTSSAAKIMKQENTMRPDGGQNKGSGGLDRIDEGNEDEEDQ